MPDIAPFRPFRFQSKDGLILAGVEIGEDSGLLPVVCLSGLTRNWRDFEALARHLAAEARQPRRVIAFDYRGRGDSDWAPDPVTYSPLQELEDVLAGLEERRVQRFVSVGTSRGGLITMLIGLSHPARLAGAVLNDIGPELDMAGLLRIKSYVGLTEPPADWDGAEAAVRRINEPYFPKLRSEDWQRFARRLFVQREDRLAWAYDPNLAATLSAVSPDAPPPPLWPAFVALSPVPTLAIRGALSDLLPAETFAEMARRHLRIETLEVAAEGHAPLLEDAPTLSRITEFLDRVDEVERFRGAARRPDAAPSGPAKAAG